MTTATLVSLAGNGFGPMVEVNGKRAEVYCEISTGKDGRRVRRYGVQVAPDYNVSGTEWAWGRSVESMLRKLNNDKRRLNVA